jgi:hypothetical protein
MVDLRVQIAQVQRRRHDAFPQRQHGQDRWPMRSRPVLDRLRFGQVTDAGAGGVRIDVTNSSRKAWRPT